MLTSIFFIKLCKLLVDIIIIMYHNINMWDNIFYFTKYIVYTKGDFYHGCN